MANKDSDLKSNKVQSLLDQLTKTADQVDENDLTGLASMHEWCQLIAEAASDTADQRMAEKASALVTDIEALIMDEVEDARSAFEAVLGLVETLESTQEVEANAPAPSPDDVTPQPEEAAESAGNGAEDAVGDEIEAKLAKVFEETPSPEDTPADTDMPMAAAETAPSYQSEPLIIDKSEIDFLGGFVEEAFEHIEAIEAAVLEVEQAPEDTVKINDLFRPFHTIKGAAGFLNLRDVTSLTHEAETVLDQGRKGERKVTPGLIDMVLDVVDILKAQMTGISGWLANPDSEAAPQPPVSAIIDRLRAVVAGQLEPGARIPSEGGADGKIGGILVEQGAVAEEVVDFALEKQQDDQDAKKIGNILTDMKTVTPRQVSQALRSQSNRPRPEGVALGSPPEGGVGVRKAPLGPLPTFT